MQSAGMHELLWQLWKTPWWVYDPQTAGQWGTIYRWFNLFEGTAWIMLAVCVLARWVRLRKSASEVAYAGAFVLFGLTDFREAWVESAPLVVVKGTVLVVLLSLRKHVLTRHYVDRKCWF